MYTSFYQSPELRRLSSTITSSPLRATEIRRSRQLASSLPLRSNSIDGFRAYQDQVSHKLNQLHAKVNTILSRSGSPVRPNRVTEAPKSSIPYHVEEAYKSNRKVAQARPRSAPRSFSLTHQDGSFSNEAYTDYVLDIKRCEGSRNFYDQEIAKKATQTPLRSRPSLDYSMGGANSPIKPARRSSSISKAWSIPIEQEVERRSASRLNSSFLGGSPVKTAKTVTWSPSVGRNKEPLYDTNKLNQIMSRIAVRQALESRTIESGIAGRSFLYAPSYKNSYAYRTPYKI